MLEADDIVDDTNIKYYIIGMRDYFEYNEQFKN